MRHSIRALFVAALVLPAGAGAQQWRTLETARQLNGVAPLAVEVGFAAGKVTLSAISGPLLYQMRMRYNEQTTDAVHHFDAEARRLELGIRSSDIGIRQITRMRHSHDEGASSLHVGLNEALPLDLTLRLGAGQARLDLGGLRLRTLVVSAGAAEADMAFGSPNRESMSRLEVDVGAAKARVKGLQHARVREIEINGGAGSVELDFGGALPEDVSIVSNLALGELHISLPRHVGITVRSKQTLSDFDAPGMTKIGNAWFSENWTNASRKVTISTQAFLGSFRLERTAP